MKNKNYFPLERNRYFHGKMLTARDFETEQKYYNDKRRIINRSIFGAGVVCGLGVYRNDDTSLSVETGLALDYTGREIVVTNPIIRKLQMIDGADQLAGHEQVYLCLEYSEQNKEPINNIGAPDSESEQYNKIEEGYRLYLDTSEPDMETIYGDSGRNHVNLIYTQNGISIYQIIPTVILAGEKFSMRFVIIKAAGLPPLSFTYSVRSDYIKGADQDSIEVVYNEDKNSNRDIHILDCLLQSEVVSDMQIPFSNKPASITVAMGDTLQQIEVPARSEIYLCGSAESYEQMVEIRLSSLEKHLAGGETPIYLAKIDYASAKNTHILRRVTALPFGQKVVTLNAMRDQKQSGALAAGPVLKGVTTETETLKYWQKPEVTVKYDGKTQNMKFRFGLPSTEAYDYATSSGIIEIPLSGTIRVNSRFFSEEIPHNLGLGHVSLTFAVEFGDNAEKKLLFGNGEVFNSKNFSDKQVPKVDVAGILYPDKGTFKLGIWCLDHVEDYVLRVRWFAYKVTRDTADLRNKEVITLSIQPEVHKMKVMERFHFKAQVNGTTDKSVEWLLQDADGGKIDQNGLYQAPSNPGTYEIVAVSKADKEVKTSAFVIVEA